VIDVGHWILTGPLNLDFEWQLYHRDCPRSEWLHGAFGVRRQAQRDAALGNLTKSKAPPPLRSVGALQRRIGSESFLIDSRCSPDFAGNW
jgi:hypothetical protein